jgi:FlaA1/EpsC-like NDP-sugar epimerase
MIEKDLNQKVILVTGAGGSIGSELVRQCLTYRPKKMILLDIYENGVYDLQQEILNYCDHTELQIIIASVRDQERIEEIMQQIKPDYVFHAAAHKHVPLMEDNPHAVVKNNILGTYYVALAAHHHSVKRFILISSDKAVNPTNLMGASKRICEILVQSINAISPTEFSAVRFGNVLGSNGSVIPLFKKQIENGGPVTVTHSDMTRYFMTIQEAVQLVLQASSLSKGGEIFVLNMGKPVKIIDLAEQMIRLSGKKPHVDIKIEFTGLRPGEKLYEELMYAEENLKQTQFTDIYIAKPKVISFMKFEAFLLSLTNFMHDNILLRDRLSNYIPSLSETQANRPTQQNAKLEEKSFETLRNA